MKKHLLLFLLALFTAILPSLAETVEFTMPWNTGWSPALPTTAAAKESTHTKNGYQIVVNNVNTANAYSNNRLILPKDKGGYITLPKFDKVVEAISIYFCSGNTTKTGLTIYEVSTGSEKEKGSITGVANDTNENKLIIKDGKVGEQYRIKNGSSNQHTISTIKVYLAETNVATPVLNPIGGSTVKVGDKLTITCATEGATLTGYIGELELDNEKFPYDYTFKEADATNGIIDILVYAEKDGIASEEIETTYTVKSTTTDPVKPATPVLSIEDGATVTEGDVLKITCATSGALLNGMIGTTDITDQEMPYQYTFTATDAEIGIIELMLCANKDGLESETIEATYTVQAASQGGGNGDDEYVYKLIDSTSDLIDGDLYIIAYEYTNKYYAASSGTGNIPAKEVTVSDDILTPTNETLILKLIKSESQYIWEVTNEGSYKGNAVNNTTSTTTTLLKNYSSATSNANYKTTVSFSNKVADITFVDTKRLFLGYTSKPDFRAYIIDNKSQGVQPKIFHRVKNSIEPEPDPEIAKPTTITFNPQAGSILTTDGIIITSDGDDPIITYTIDGEIKEKTFTGEPIYLTTVGMHTIYAKAANEAGFVTAQASYNVSQPSSDIQPDASATVTFTDHQDWGYDKNQNYKLTWISDDKNLEFETVATLNDMEAYPGEVSKGNSTAPKCYSDGLRMYYSSYNSILVNAPKGYKFVSLEFAMSTSTVKIDGNDLTNNKFNFTTPVESFKITCKNANNAIKSVTIGLVKIPTVPGVLTLSHNGGEELILENTEVNASAENATYYIVRTYGIDGTYTEETVEDVEATFTVDKMHRRFEVIAGNAMGETAKEAFYNLGYEKTVPSGSGEKVYKLVESPDELATGDKIVIANVYQGSVGFLSTNINTANNGGFYKTEDMAMPADVNYLTSLPTETMIIQLSEASENGMFNLKYGSQYFKSGDGTLHLDAKNSSTSAYKFEIVDGIHKLGTTAGSKTVYIKFNSGINSFRSYASNQADITVFKEVVNQTTTTTIEPLEVEYGMSVLHKEISVEDAQKGTTAGGEELDNTTPLQTGETQDGITMYNVTINNVIGEFALNIEGMKLMGHIDEVTHFDHEPIYEEKDDNGNIIKPGCQGGHAPYVVIRPTKADISGDFRTLDATIPGTYKLVDSTSDNAVAMSTNENVYHGYTNHYSDITLHVDLDPFKSIKMTALTSGDTVGVGNVVVDGEGKVEYYNLQGVRVVNPIPGNVYIVRKGDTATKVLVK